MGPFFSLIEEWLMKNDFQPVVGHRFNLRTTPVAHWNGVTDCEALVVEPNEGLSYSWNASGEEAAGGLRTVGSEPPPLRTDLKILLHCLGAVGHKESSSRGDHTTNRRLAETRAGLRRCSDRRRLVQWRISGPFSGARRPSGTRWKTCGFQKKMSCC
jgi:uncharacterized protein YndB with AHSA1/START domain